MELPKLKSKNKNLVKKFGLMMTPEMMDRLIRMRAFEGIDTSEWVRTLIQKGLESVDDKTKAG